MFWNIDWNTLAAFFAVSVGIGGIASPEDALEFIIAGARAVQVGTANFYDPSTSIRIVEGIRDYCVRKKVQLADLVGSLRVG